MEVVDTVSAFVYLVKPLGSRHTPKPIHVQRLKRYSDNSIGRPAKLVEMAQREAGVFTIESLQE